MHKLKWYGNKEFPICSLRGITMEKEGMVKGRAIHEEVLFYKGQRVMYQGREAKVINVNPVFTIRIEGKHEIICGDIANEVSPQGS